MKKQIVLCFLCASIFQMYAQSPYSNKVYDFKPAPGQYINELPEYEAHDRLENMIIKAQESIIAEEKGMISLGGYGGYVVFGFDHAVQNVPGKYDFKIWGNAFYAESNPNPDASGEGGSCEPGIVMVSHDDNGNGLPDDPWYELAGSEYHKPQTIKNYKITYYKPNPNKTPTPNQNYPFLNDTTYIKWKSNQGDSGYVYKNTFHQQSYYPLWEECDSLVFEGTKLENNYKDESGNGSYFVQYAYRWGYADNQPNTNNRSAFDISWAVDKEGNSVSLPEINFVKVYTAVNQYCGWLGETSTEVMGAEDLHLKGFDIEVPAYTEGLKLNDTSLNIEKGEHISLIVNVISSNPSQEKIVWSVKNPNLISINEKGEFTALAQGETFVVAQSSDGKHRDSCKLTITDNSVKKEEVQQNSIPQVYCKQQTLYLYNFQGSQCSIFTIGARLIESFQVQSSFQTKTVNQPPGVYLIKANTKYKTQTYKFIID